MCTYTQEHLVEGSGDDGRGTTLVHLYLITQRSLGHTHGNYWCGGGCSLVMHMNLTEFIILNTRFIMFNTKIIILNGKSHRVVDRGVEDSAQVFLLGPCVLWLSTHHFVSIKSSFCRYQSSILMQTAHIASIARPHPAPSGGSNTSAVSNKHVIKDGLHVFVPI